MGLGGNKLRNLEFLVGDAIAQGADTLVTSGRRWSNYCRLTAAAAARVGLGCPPRRDRPADRPPGPGRRLMEAYGATVHVTSGGELAEREALVASVVDDLRRQGRSPYLVGVGGSSELGAIGHVLAGIELAEQAVAEGIRPGVVVLPSATGGTRPAFWSGWRRRESTPESSAWPWRAPPTSCGR